MTDSKLISIIIPIYKDASTIDKTIHQTMDFFKEGGLLGELIIVNDGGQDGGVDIVRAAMRQYSNIALINRDTNKGKGYTVREGIRRAAGDFIFYTDADLPYPFDSIKEILRMLRSGEADLVMVNRNLSGIIGNKRMPFLRRITHKIFSVFVRALLFEFSDSLAGLKGMTKLAAQLIVPHLVIDKFSFDVEFLLVAKRLGLRIKEIPVVLKNVGISNLSVIADSPQMIKDVIKIIIRDKLYYYRFKK